MSSRECVQNISIRSSSNAGSASTETSQGALERLSSVVTTRSAVYRPARSGVNTRSGTVGSLSRTALEAAGRSVNLHVNDVIACPRGSKLSWPANRAVAPGRVTVGGATSQTATGRSGLPVSTTSVSTTSVSAVASVSVPLCSARSSGVIRGKHPINAAVTIAGTRTLARLGIIAPPPPHGSPRVTPSGSLALPR